MTNSLPYTIGPPKRPFEWSKFWSKTELETHFTARDRQSETSDGVDIWWQDTASNLWDSILEPIEDKCQKAQPGQSYEYALFQHAPLQIQLLCTLRRLDGEVSNGGIHQWVGNRPLMALAVPQALRLIDQHDLAHWIESYAWAELSDTDNQKQFSLIKPNRLLAVFPPAIKSAPVLTMGARDALAEKIDTYLKGPSREQFARKMRAFTIRSAHRLPNESASLNPT